jgi:hypothetical protein
MGFIWTLLSWFISENICCLLFVFPYRE